MVVLAAAGALGTAWAIGVNTVADTAAVTDDTVQIPETGDVAGQDRAPDRERDEVARPLPQVSPARPAPSHAQSNGS